MKLTSQNGVQQQQRSGQLKPIFEVRDLSGHGFSDVNFTVSAGEVLTITGVVGAGRTELAETIFGVRKPSKGQLILDGREIQIKNPSGRSTTVWLRARKPPSARRVPRLKPGRQCVFQCDGAPICLPKRLQEAEGPLPEDHERSADQGQV